MCDENIVANMLNMLIKIFHDAAQFELIAQGFSSRVTYHLMMCKLVMVLLIIRKMKPEEEKAGNLQSIPTCVQMFPFAM
jgi:hypothetical protein